MPSLQEVRWSQLKVGLIVLVSSLLLIALIFLMTASNGLSFFSHRISAVTYFENSAGLKPGAEVNLQGVTIGTVKSVTIDPSSARKLTPVRVLMQMDSKYTGRVRKDSLVSLSTIGVLGDTVVDINSQVATGPPIQSGDELKTTETPDLQDVVKASQGTIESLNVILAKLNSIVDNLQTGKGTFGQLINNPDLYNKFSATTDDLHKLAVNLNGVLSDDQNSVGKLIHDKGELYGHVNHTLATLDSIVSDVQSGKGSLGILLKDPEVANNLNHSLADLRTILDDANAGKGGLGLMVKDPAFAGKLNNTLTQIDSIVTKANGGTGTLGKLVNDDTLYTNLNKLTTASTDLVTTIRKDPKKYLTIHMRIF
jgi:phospholipid/cholesterol/gamma-HCH transport system substrate-binding protein